MRCRLSPVTRLLACEARHKLSAACVVVAVLLLGGSAATLEVVWSVTDPPLNALRRVIPPLRIGTVSVDLASLVLLVILYVLMNVVVRQLIH